MTVTFTEHFRFGIPDFTSSPWHEDFEALVQDIDRVLFNALFGVGFTVWANSTAYQPGDRVISPEDSSLWLAQTAHTSAVSPTTFSQERINNPSYWSAFGGYTNEQAQDAVGTILTDTQTITWTYDDNLPGISASVKVLETTAALNLFTSILKGLVPGSGGGTVNFLRADGNWATPPGGGGGGGLADAYQVITDGIGSSIAVGAGTFKLRAASPLNVAVQNDDVTHGDNALFSLANGDYGDIVLSSGGAVWTIDSNAVTYSKMQDFSAASKLLGRGSGAGPFDPQEITLGVNLSMSGTTLNADSELVPLPPKGRLTLSTGVPVMSTAVAGGITVFYTPHGGNTVPIWNGTKFTNKTFAETSQTLADTTKSPGATAADNLYDLFVWSDAGTIRCTRGPAWSGSTTSGAAIVSVGAPAVVTWNNHGLHAGHIVIFSGAGLPTGVTAGTLYYVGKLPTTNTFNIATTLSNALNGVFITTSGTSTGTQTVTAREAARGTGAGTTELTRVQGILANAQAITNGPAAGFGTYVGTIRTNSINQVAFNPAGLGTGGAACGSDIWNYYNRTPFTFVNKDNGTPYVYTDTSGSGGARPARGSVSNLIRYVCGVVEAGFVAFADELIQTPNVISDFASFFWGHNDVVADASAAWTNPTANGAQIKIGASGGALPVLGSGFILGGDSAGNSANNKTFYGIKLTLQIET